MKKSEKEQKLRIKLKKAARRSGKLTEKEGKVSDSKTKKKFTMSQKRAATIRKSRYWDMSKPNVSNIWYEPLMVLIRKNQWLVTNGFKMNLQKIGSHKLVSSNFQLV